MIICGYPGIGKSSVAKLNPTFIDLESSNFYMNNICCDYDNEQKPVPDWDNRPKFWYIYYTNIAIDLSNKDYTVFLSCHPEVRHQLECRLDEIGDRNILVIIPSADIEKEWHDRLEDRYLLTHSPKDLRALNRVSKLADDVEDVRSGSLPTVLIRDIKDYDLRKVLINYASGLSWDCKKFLVREVDENAKRP
jgi:hypothetical protein